MKAYGSLHHGRGGWTLALGALLAAGALLAYSGEEPPATTGQPSTRPAVRQVSADANTPGSISAGMDENE
ncbi:MAG: hypothetical protein ACLFV7_01960 [Phycisphaerae bacterium]